MNISRAPERDLPNGEPCPQDYTNADLLPTLNRAQKEIQSGVESSDSSKLKILRRTQALTSMPTQKSPLLSSPLCLSGKLKPWMISLHCLIPQQALMPLIARINGKCPVSDLSSLPLLTVEVRRQSSSLKPRVAKIWMTTKAVSCRSRQ